ncbi:hypothetical protein [Novosphingobium sp. Chol11]|uniref:hypothetical protein n=1 Tax=Novosphingobium sp. Chol11 TaxID=1385763 RepID=UPI0025EBF368|nr:hypothetical protein [Novosphingobium sp. Chol11]
MQTLARMSERGPTRDSRRLERIRAAIHSGAAGLRLVDVSAFGCQFEGGALEDGRVGQFVEIDFGSDIITRAIIRWSEPNRMGLEFTRPLAGAQVDKVVQTPTRVKLRRL